MKQLDRDMIKLAYEQGRGIYIAFRHIEFPFRKARSCKNCEHIELDYNFNRVGCYAGFKTKKGEPLEICCPVRYTTASSEYYAYLVRCQLIKNWSTGVAGG